MTNENIVNQGILVNIDKTIPVPEDKSQIFREMEVGDSVLIPNEGHDGKTYQRAKKYFQRNGKKMKARKEGVNIRIWRVE